mmetsp:Transcript_4369/g.6439  ORF Transcript_4369/g.6439 Transcript_4369/m.6439 type:complete len:216 (-) Transcript_4369:107-754(-)
MVSCDLSHSTRHDFDGLRRTIPLAHGPSLDLAHEGHRLLIQHLAEDNVLAIEPRGGNSRDEKLRPVGVGTGVGHRKLSGLGVLELEVLVSELLAVDRLAASTITTGEITTLEHEALDNAVELGTSVTETLLARAQGREVSRRLRHVLVVQAHVDLASGLASNGDIKINFAHHLSSRGRAATETEQVAKSGELGSAAKRVDARRGAAGKGQRSLAH